MGVRDTEVQLYVHVDVHTVLARSYDMVMFWELCPFITILCVMHNVWAIHDVYCHDCQVIWGGGHEDISLKNIC